MLLRQVTEKTIRAVQYRGWAITESKTTAELLEFGQALGEIMPSRMGGPLVDELRPKQASEAAANSLSGRHGFGSFPYHTDATHHALPPRYVLLRLASRTAPACRTLLAPMPPRLRRRDRETLEHDVWLVDGGRGRFLTSLLSAPDGGSEEMYRFDEGCMRPAPTPALVRRVT